MIVFEKLTSDQGVGESLQSNSEEKVPRMTLKVIILELVVTEVGVWGKQGHVDGRPSKMEDESLGEAENVIIDSCDSRFSLFRKHIL